MNRTGTDSTVQKEAPSPCVHDTWWERGKVGAGRKGERSVFVDGRDWVGIGRQGVRMGRQGVAMWVCVALSSLC